MAKTVKTLINRLLLNNDEIYKGIIIEGNNYGITEEYIGRFLAQIYYILEIQYEK
jgi:hypothetical protein